MNLKKFSLLLGLGLLFNISHAEYKVIIGLQDINFTKWEPTSPITGEWSNIDEPYDCTNWSPSTDTINQETSFVQNANDCKQNQQREIQIRLVNNKTGEFKTIETQIESRVLSEQINSRTATGTKIAEDCRFVKNTANGSGSGNYYVMETGGTTTAYWNGQKMGQINYRSPKYVFVNGQYKYYSKQLMVTDSYYYHNICKSPI
jgi:hypothetical protein